MYSSLHHPACSQQRAQYGQKQRRQDERAGGNQQLDGCTLDLALDRGAMSRTDLATLSGQRLGYFYMNGKQYEILAEINRQQRNKPADLRSIYVRSDKGEMIQMDNLISLAENASGNYSSLF